MRWAAPVTPAVRVNRWLSGGVGGFNRKLMSLMGIAIALILWFYRTPTLPGHFPTPGRWPSAEFEAGCCHGGRRSRLIRIPVTALLFAGPGGLFNRIKHTHPPEQGFWVTSAGSRPSSAGSQTRTISHRFPRREGVGNVCSGLGVFTVCCTHGSRDTCHQRRGVGSFVRLSFPTELHGVAQPGVRVRRHGRAHGGAFRYVFPAKTWILQDFCVFWGCLLIPPLGY